MEHELEYLTNKTIEEVSEIDAEFNFATIGAVYSDGVSLIFDGTNTATTKHYKVNKSASYEAGDRVKICKDSGTYIVEYPIGEEGGGGGGSSGITVTTLYSGSTTSNVTIDLSSYKLVICEFQDYDNNRISVTCQIDNVQRQVTGAYRLNTSNMFLISREFTVATTGVRIGYCYSVKNTIGVGVRESYALPLVRIYGIK